MASKYLGLDCTKKQKEKETKNPTINLKIRLFFESDFFFKRKELNKGRKESKKRIKWERNEHDAISVLVLNTDVM